MAYTLIISGDKPYTPLEGVDEMRSELGAERGTEHYNQHRQQETNEIKQALTALSAQLSQSGHTVREVLLDGERVQ